jgi:hypothetical protein
MAFAIFCREMLVSKHGEIVELILLNAGKDNGLHVGTTMHGRAGPGLGN